MLAFAASLFAAAGGRGADSAPVLLSKIGGGSAWSTVAELNAAAQRGLPKACAQLGEMLLRGTDVPQDGPRALSLLEQAARGGVRTSIFNLGAFYANGRGTATNYPEALAWLIVAKHYNLDSGQVTVIRDYLAKTQPAQVPLAEKRAANRIREIDALRD